jgi:hypothetical protein
MQQIASTQQMVIGLIGLPARGKTPYARKLIRYLLWLGYSGRVFNLANYRRQVSKLVSIPEFWYWRQPFILRFAQRGGLEDHQELHKPGSKRHVEVCG